MNSLDLQTKRNNTRRFFRHQSGIHVNCIRLNTTNSYEHERQKFEECWKLACAGKSYLTEAEFNNPFKKRADVVNLDNSYAIEIQGSESDESIGEKRKTYPIPIIVVKI